jgi:hypothetical protein
LRRMGMPDTTRDNGRRVAASNTSDLARQRQSGSALSV